MHTPAFGVCSKLAGLAISTLECSFENARLEVFVWKLDRNLVVTNKTYDSRHAQLLFVEAKDLPRFDASAPFSPGFMFQVENDLQPRFKTDSIEILVYE